MKENNLIIVKIIFILFAIILVPLKAYAIVGQSLNSMVSEYGQPKSIPLYTAITHKSLEKYQSQGVNVSSYMFTINGHKIIALFNSNNICYEMKSRNNRTLPKLSDFIGSLANTKPIVLKKKWLRSITLQYGTGNNRILYSSYGFPGDISVYVYSPSLKP
jgi:hypothetical protein